MMNKTEDTDLDVMPYLLTEEETEPLHKRLDKCHEKLKEVKALQHKNINGNGTKRAVIANDSKQTNNNRDSK